jgi:hypothetical protein
LPPRPPRPEPWRAPATLGLASPTGRPARRQELIDLTDRCDDSGSRVPSTLLNGGGGDGRRGWRA